MRISDWSSDVCSSDLLLAVLLGSLTTDLGVGSGAEAAGELAADVELHVGVAHEQRLRGGVDGDELEALQACVDHAVDGVEAAAAEPDDLDYRQVVLRVAEHWSGYPHEGVQANPGEEKPQGADRSLGVREGAGPTA